MEGSDFVVFAFYQEDGDITGDCEGEVRAGGWEGGGVGSCVYPCLPLSSVFGLG